MQEYIVTIDTIGEAARARMLQCDPVTISARGGAEIDYMTPEELQELHRLKMALPTFSEEREAARDRIKARIAERRRVIAKITGGAA